MAGTIKSMAESILATPFSAKGGEGSNDLFGANDSFTAINDASGTSARTLKSQIQEKEKELMTLGQHRVRILESQVEQLEDSVRAKDRELRAKDVELQARQAELSGRDRDLREKQRELGDVREKLEKMDKEGKSALLALRAHEEEQHALETELRDLRSKLAAAEREVGDQRRQVRELEAAGAAHEQKATELLAQVTEAEQRAARAEEAGQQMARSHAGQTQRMAEEADARIAQLQAELRQARAESAQREQEAAHGLEDAMARAREEWERRDHDMAAQFREKEREMARQMQAELEERLQQVVEQVRRGEVDGAERRVAQLEEQLRGCQHTIEQQAHDLDVATEEAASLHAAMRVLEADRDAVADASARMQDEFRAALQARDGDALLLLDSKVAEMEAAAAEREHAHAEAMEALRAERQQLEERFDAFLADKEAEFAGVLAREQARWEEVLTGRDRDVEQQMEDAEGAWAARLAAQQAGWQEDVTGLREELLARLQEREDQVAALEEECRALQGVVEELEGQLARERADTRAEMDALEAEWKAEAEAARREWEEEHGRLAGELRLAGDSEAALAREVEERARETDDVERVWRERLASAEAALQRAVEEAVEEERREAERRLRMVVAEHEEEVRALEARLRAQRQEGGGGGETRALREEVDVLERRCAELSAQLDEVTRSAMPRENLDLGDAQLIHELRVELEKAHASLDAYSEELKASLRREGAINQQCEGLQADLADLRRHSEDYAAQQDEKCQLLAQQIHALEAHKATLQAAVGEMRREDALVRELQAEVTRLQEGAARTAQEAELASKREQERVQDHAAREAGWAQERERMSASHAEQMRTQAETMERAQQQQAAALSEADQAKGALKAEVERLLATLTTLKGERDAVDQLRQQAEARSAEGEARVRELQRELLSMREGHYQARVAAASNATTAAEPSFSFARASATLDSANARPPAASSNLPPATHPSSASDLPGASRRRGGIKGGAVVEADVQRLRDQIESLEQSFATRFQKGDAAGVAANGMTGYGTVPGLDARLQSPPRMHKDHGGGSGGALDAFMWRPPYPAQPSQGPATAPAYSPPPPPQTAPPPAGGPALSAAAGTLDYLSGRLSALHQHMSVFRPQARPWDPLAAQPGAGGMLGAGLPGVLPFGLASTMPAGSGFGSTAMTGAARSNPTAGMEASVYGSPLMGSAWATERPLYGGAGVPYEDLAAGRTYGLARHIPSQQALYPSATASLGNPEAGFNYPVADTTMRSPRAGSADNSDLLPKTNTQDAIGRIMLAKATLEAANHKSALDLQGQRTRLKAASKLISALK